MEPKPAAQREVAIEILEPVAVITDATLRITATKIMLGLFACSVAATFAIIVGYGRGYLKYPEWFLKWLGAATIGEIATFLGYILKYLFQQPAKIRKKK